MIFRETELKGVYLLEPQGFQDERGLFATLFRSHEFELRNMTTQFVEHNIAFSKEAGTLRGIHYQAAPHGQAKLVRCTRGAVFDVALDLRPDSPTFKKWTGVELSADNRFMMYLPRDFGHGYQTLAPDTEVFYMVSQPYAPQSGRGVRWNDPAFSIAWPHTERRILLKRDLEYPDFTL